jgi:hypothetical protein
MLLDDFGTPHVNDHLEARYYTNTAIKYGGMGAEIKICSIAGTSRTVSLKGHSHKKFLRLSLQIID